MEINFWEALSTLTMIGLSIFGWYVVAKMIKNHKGKLEFWDMFFILWQIFYALYVLYNVGELVWSVIQ